MFQLNPQLCTECQICMEICTWEHHHELNPKRSRIRVRGSWPEPPRIMVCMACRERQCIHACPTGALTWEGFVRLETHLCDSCGNCQSACPVQGVFMDPHGALPLICDTCGGNFPCVGLCPTGALRKKGI